jgi:hypothetical protein
LPYAFLSFLFPLLIIEQATGLFLKSWADTNRASSFF